MHHPNNIHGLACVASPQTVFFVALTSNKVKYAVSRKIYMISVYLCGNLATFVLKQCKSSLVCEMPEDNIFPFGNLSTRFPRYLRTMTKD